MINETVAYRKLSDDGLDRIARLREAFSVSRQIIDMACPKSRQKSVSIRAFEKAETWAIKAAVFNDPKSEASK